MIEQPLVGLGEIATFLKVGETKAREILERSGAPLLPAYKPLLAILPSDLLKALKMERGKKGIESISKGT